MALGNGLFGALRCLSPPWSLPFPFGQGLLVLLALPETLRVAKHTTGPLVWGVRPLHFLALGATALWGPTRIPVELRVPPVLPTEGLPGLAVWNAAPACEFPLELFCYKIFS